MRLPWLWTPIHSPIRAPFTLADIGYLSVRKRPSRLYVTNLPCPSSPALTEGAVMLHDVGHCVACFVDPEDGSCRDFHDLLLSDLNHPPTIADEAGVTPAKGHPSLLARP